MWYFNTTLDGRVYDPEKYELKLRREYIEKQIERNNRFIEGLQERIVEVQEENKSLKEKLKEKD